MPYFLRFLLVIYLSLFYVWLSVPAHAQDVTTSNLINPTQFTGQSMSGAIGGVPPNSIFGGVSGGPGAFVDTSGGGAIHFSWGQSTVGQTIAINQALSAAGVGIAIKGFNYFYEYYNSGENRGSLSASINMTSNTGSVLENYNWNHNGETGGQWAVNMGTKTFTNPYSLASVGNLTMSFTGKDATFWAGYYGPIVRNPSLSLTYGLDACAANPLSSPDCPGYATAYFNQQCTVSALYNPSCPGYAQAYFTQQCTANPLYNPACPGYQEAYFAYQCQQDGLYSTSCPNYAEAYAKKNILNIGSTTTTTTTTTTSTDTNTTAPKTDPVAIATTSTTTSTTSPTSVTSTTSVISSGSSTTTAIPTTQTTAAPPPPTDDTQEARKTNAEIKSASAGPGAPGPRDSKDTGNTMKARVESRAKEVAKEAGNAKTFEEQASKQGLVVGLMGYVPGFDTYGNARIIDVNGLQMARQYSKDNVDNRSVLRRLSGASDRLHNEMVDQQYK